MQQRRWSHGNIQQSGGAIFHVCLSRPCFDLLRKQTGKFCYHLKFQKKFDDKPMWAIFIRNILKVENNHKGKAGCWFLDSEFAKDQNMTCAKEADAKKWCDAINFLKGYYKDKPKLEWETLDNGFEIDPRVIIEIQIALEKGPFKEQVKIARDHAECLEAKKIKKYLERVGTSKLENRMATGFMKKNTGTMIEAD